MTFGSQWLNRLCRQLGVMKFQVGLDLPLSRVIDATGELSDFEGDGIQPTFSKQLTTVAFGFQLAALLLSDMFTAGCDQLVVQH
ncbi:MULTISPECIES: hypothetical protein [Pseudomonas]|uniref:hypothetical protein n=1 Tax=Pseudomonas sp. T8 TaxID=645292 RepID=UPI002148F0DF|nr:MULTISPECIES: hypothetical protein [Pseudomonas]UUT23009.1 hypothetical protein NRG23_03365 [Pseudomonas sp. T8]WJV26343.1 hypothetical protein PSR66_10020 [Pseudomonas chlororaphis]